MDIKKYETIDVSSGYYNMRDKLKDHIFNRSLKAFRLADDVRDNIKTKEELKEYAKNMREKFIEHMGGIPYDSSLPLYAQTTKIIEEEHLFIENVIFQSRPNVYVTANLYIPKNRKEKCGAVLCQCGHALEGKAYKRYQKSVREIASSGLICLCVDPLGQGERLSYIEDGFSSPLVGGCTHEHQYAGEQCVLSGDSITRYFIADAMRAVDYLTQRPEVDPEKIGACGTSGGGTQTCHMMVCDERIKAAAPGTFVTNRSEYLLTGNPQDSEQIWWGATEYGFDHNELLMCFAPKALMLLVVDSDFFAIEGTKEVYEKSKRFWEMFEKAEDLQMSVDKSTHAFTDKIAIDAGRFFAKALNGEDRTYIKEAVNPIDESELSCTKSGQVKRDYPDAKIVYDENIERINSFKKDHDLKKAKDFIKNAVNFKRVPCEFNMRRPMGREIIDSGYGINANMWFSQKHMPTFAVTFRNIQSKEENRPLVICLWDNGTNDLEGHILKIRKMCDENNTVSVVDLSAMGKNMPDMLNSAYGVKNRHGVIDKLTKDLFFLKDSLCALRIYELSKAIEALKEEYKAKKVKIYAEGKSAIIADLFSMISDEAEIEIVNGESLKEIAHNKYYEDYNCSGYLLPGILKYVEI